MCCLWLQDSCPCRSIQWSSRMPSASVVKRRKCGFSGSVWKNASDNGRWQWPCGCSRWALCSGCLAIALNSTSTQNLFSTMAAIFVPTVRRFIPSSLAETSVQQLLNSVPVSVVLWGFLVMQYFFFASDAWCLSLRRIPCRSWRSWHRYRWSK